MTNRATGRLCGPRCPGILGVQELLVRDRQWVTEGVTGLRLLLAQQPGQLG